MCSKKKYILLLTIVGLFLYRPTLSYANTAKQWTIDVESHGLVMEHIAGDTFRVEIRFSNRTAGWMHDINAKLYYPEGVEPILARFHKNMVSRFPPDGHFIDFDKRYIEFQFPDSTLDSPNKFFAFFTTTKYGKAEFEYLIRWRDSDSLVYEQSRSGQCVIFPMNKTITDSTDSLIESNLDVLPKIHDEDSGGTYEFPGSLIILLGSLVLVALIVIWIAIFINYREKTNKTLKILIEAQKRLIAKELEILEEKKNDISEIDE